VTASAAWESAAGWTSAFIREKQLNDRDIRPALMWVESGDRPPCKKPHLCYGRYGNNLLTVRNGVLYRLFYNSAGSVTQFQLILPADMKAPFLELVHSNAAAHLKFAKCV